MDSKETSSIAVIGMGCRYAGGANSPEALWKLLVEKRNGYSAVPKDRFNWEAFYHPDANVRGTTIQKGGHFLDQDIGSFDPSFFGIPPTEAEFMDPQQRLVLETSWEAVENAGICMEQFRGSDTGVFVAMFGHDWEHVVTKDPLLYTNYHSTGVARTLLSNRVSYVFDLKGPSITLDTGCSGSLVAVNSACQSLRYGETDVALAGGVGLVFSPDQLALMSPVGIFNKDGRCYSFDDRGSGYGRAEGVGIVVLKRLDDAIRDGDDIRAVIRNTCANQDGRTNGITLPSQYGQERLARKLFEKLDFSPKDVHYVEAHGTGTQAGDAAEIRAISNVFGEGRDENQPLLVGTAKPNIGHSESASGSAGLIRTILAMEKGCIPPNILLDTPKPSIAPYLKVVKIPQTLEPWPSTTTTRKAVVNSFGSGGTNAMVALESSERLLRKKVNGTNGTLNGNHITVNGVNGGNGVNNLVNLNETTEISTSRLFVLSARSEHSLLHGQSDLRKWLIEQQDVASVNLGDLSHTLVARRSHFQWRSSVIASDVESLIEKLTAKEAAPTKASPRRTNVFVFTGQGAQYFQMGYHLIATETDFAKSIHNSDQILQDLGASWSLAEELLKEESTSLLNDSTYGQPASTAIQLAIVDLLRSWEVVPSAVVGHSSGEIAAAYAAGVITHETAIRIAYERSFLASAAKKRNKHPGSMMAVGLGEKGVLEIIQSLSLTDLRVVVACVNSPSSTTVSGDAPAVLQLHEALKEKGTFARLLKVDTAYHSHHMQTVSKDYLSRLDGIRSEALVEHSSVRFFSSVTGTEKLDGFGASYWVENLVNQVRFSQALDCLCRQVGGKEPFNFIEIGPHKALGGPIRQSVCHLQANGSIYYRYIPTLVRGENSRTSLMETGSSLYISGGKINIKTVASLGLPKASIKKAKAVRDLPPYHWNHTQSYWNEPRLSRDYRCRRHPHHDLLGLRTLTSSDNEPNWRLIISLQALPWLKDHVVDKFVIFPGASYMAMAIEAVKQRTQDQHPNMAIKGYRLKNVSFKRTLSVPDDSNGVEVILNLRQSNSCTGYDFCVSSNPDGEKWQIHCDGHISVEAQLDMDEVEQGRAAHSQKEAYAGELATARQTCSQTISKEELYAELTKVGNRYGPSFALVENARIADSKSVSTVVLPDIASTMPSGFMQPHVIHPAFFDALLHTCVLLFHRHESSSNGSVVPTFFSETFISSSILNQPGHKLQALCKLHTTYTSSSNFDLIAFQESTHEQGAQSIQPVLTLFNGELRVIGESQASDTSADASEQNVYTVRRGLDISSVTAKDLESIVIPLQSDEVGMSPAEKVTLLHSAASRYIDLAVKEIRQGGLKVQDDYRVDQFAWMSQYIDSEAGKLLLQQTPDSEETVRETLSKLGGEGELIMKLGSKLTGILTGETDPISILLDDDLLYRLYSSDEIARGNRYMAEYTKHLTFQRRGLRILEIGAGTGGATLPLFQQCSPNGEPFCAEYVFTDVSAGFFKNVRETKLKDWEQLINFQTLDLEADPVSQGFEEHGYDLVLASNVVHATKSLSNSLHNIHRLLKPGGVLGLVEVVKTTPWYNMTFGSLPGWWAGVAEGRTEGPLQSVSQWGQHLVEASFSGIELVAYDFPEPATQCAFVVSEALAKLEINGNGHANTGERIQIVSTSPNKHNWEHGFCTALQQKLSERGLQGAVQPWLNIQAAGEATDKTSYVIVDSAAHPFLAHASSAQFEDIISILTKASRLYWITLSSDSGAETLDKLGSHGIVTGLARSAHNETDGLRFVTIDVQDKLQSAPTDLEERTTEILANLIVSSKTHADDPHSSLELEYTLKDGKLHIERVVPESQLTRMFSTNEEERVKLEVCYFHQANRPLKVHLAKPGLLSSMQFVDNEDLIYSRELDPDEVEIEVHACGVNFKDVFIALGQMKPTQKMVGEGAGIVTRVGSNFASRYSVGQRVAVVTGTPYASRTRANGHLIHPIPSSLSFNDAASIPVAYTTAFYGLVDCANLTKGQSVLIHAASGGLGQAAIMIAQHIGANIFVTVGSKDKASLLIEKYNIPESHIFSSRTTDFKTSIMHLTNQQGVDVVLNSLSGEALRATWECVAPMGTFVEVGKTDIYRRSQLDMEPFDRNIKFAAVDLIVVSKHRPQLIQELLRRIFKHVAAGHFSPLPVTSIPIANIERAFRLIQSRKHTGKIVLEADPKSALVEATAPELRLHPDGIYVIAGGLGSIGRRLCRHLQVRGARHIALLSRRSFDVESRTKLEQELAETPDSAVKILTCDVLNPADVSHAAEQLNASFPVRGVIHGAMLLKDHTLTQMHLDDFQAGLKPKYYGTINLAKAFTSDNLDFFIMLSSLAGIVGLPGQSNYAAGNVFQDEFVHSQVSRGHNQFISLDLPLIKETELMSKETMALVMRHGVEVVPIDAIISVMEYAISGRARKDGNNHIVFGISAKSILDRVHNNIAIPPLLDHIFAKSQQEPKLKSKNSPELKAEDAIAQASSREEAEQLILVALRDKVSALIAVDAQELSVDDPMAVLGLDSLVAIELKNWLTKKLQAAVQTTDIMDAPSLTSFAAFILEKSALITNK
ncbi:putative polyketide synthase [Xylariaceae sp. FL1651]|nr:putative polyketide synthase [Xylariaceae sp. FL1651]